jgi:transcriptional regulator with XRE-family HTH domain
MKGQKFRILLGLRVKALRRRCGMTQEQLAEKINKSTVTVSNIECGVVSMRLETVVIVAKSLSVTLSELFDFEPTNLSKGRTHRNAIEALVRLVQPLELDRAVQFSEVSPRSNGV